MRRGGRLRPALTVRGRGFISAGLSILGCALFLDQRDLTRLAIIVLALPLVSLILTLIGRPRLDVTRTVAGQAIVGESAGVQLTLGNDGRRLDGLLVADPLPTAIGTTARFSISALPTGQTRTVTYSVSPTSRGRHTLGPLRVSSTDPLGLATITRSVGQATDLVVYPAVVPLDQQIAGSCADTGIETSSHVAEAGSHSMAVREYRAGDDLRRVHWRTTARRGELMVRADEHAMIQHATVLLDNRFVSHQRAQCGTAGFELPVSLAASICEDLRLRGFHVTLLTQDATGAPVAHQESHLAVLAGITLTRQSQPLARLVTATPEQPGPLIAIVGALDAVDTASLGALRGSRRLLFSRPPTRGPGDDGWVTTTLTPGTTVAQAWNSAVGVTP